MGPLVYFAKLSAALQQDPDGRRFWQRPSLMTGIMRGDHLNQTAARNNYRESTFGPAPSMTYAANASESGQNMTQRPKDSRDTQANVVQRAVGSNASPRVTAQAQSSYRQAAENPTQAQSYADWSKGREGWSEDARKRRYARSAAGMANSMNRTGL